MEFRDYYKILGLDKTASVEKIKSAYRKLAKQYHPDKNPGDRSAEEKFKEINEAYAVLSDPEKRKKYDAIGENWRQYEHQGNGRDEFDWSQWKGRREKHGGFSSSDFSDFFETIFGGTRTRSSPGQNIEAEMILSLEDAYNGTTRRVELDGEMLQINIRPGVNDRQVLRIKEKGGRSSHRGQRGDILINVRINSHKLFQRKDNDLYTEAFVGLYTAMLGGTSVINSLKGPIKINIVPGTDNGKVLRLKNMGMPVFGKEDTFGDLYVTVKILLPRDLSQKEQGLLRQLQKLRTD